MPIVITSLVLVVLAVGAVGYITTESIIGAPPVSATTDAALKVGYPIVAEALLLFIIVPRPGGNLLYQVMPTAAWALFGIAVVLGCCHLTRIVSLAVNFLIDLHRSKNTKGTTSYPPVSR
jgi:hypothetical protein